MINLLTLTLQKKEIISWILRNMSEWSEISLMPNFLQVFMSEKNILAQYNVIR